MNKAIVMLVMLIGITSISKAQPVVQPKTDSVYICQSRSAYAYHRYVCRGLAHCKHKFKKITKAEAIKLGYSACKICY